MGNATIPVLPPSLPPYLVDQASGGAQVLPNHTGGSIHSPGFQSPTPSFIGVHTTGNSSIRSQPHSRPPPPTVPSRSTYAVAPQLTGQPFPLARPLQQAWDITADEKAGTDAHFDTLDVKRTGYIDGGQAVPFMMLSNLPEDILARIWYVFPIIPHIYKAHEQTGIYPISEMKENLIRIHLRWQCISLMVF